MLRALVVVGGAVAATAVAWAVAGGTAGADTLLPPGLIGPGTAGAPAATVLSAVDPGPVAGELGRLDEVVHDVARPVRRLLTAAARVQRSQAAHDVPGQALSVTSGVLKATAKGLLGDETESMPRRAAQTMSAPVDPVSTVDRPAVRGDGAAAAAPDIVEGATTVGTAIPERSAPEASPADRGDVRSPAEVERETGARHGQLPLPLPLPPSPSAGSTATVTAAHGGNDGCGATLSGNPARHQSRAEIRRPAAHRSVANTACQPGVTPD
ncbi:hypothetical protein [Amycolatopsis sp. GA6-003]|uniref:hypothetical protein n=1 Tax=Amycolatopsis sp. GA6-003 TaxID=2652444 RepID=UPI0039173712